MHLFEKAGLGVAPFRLVGFRQKRYCPAPGAPSMPGDSCDYCGTAIVDCCEILSADGQRFTVGNECVKKTGDAGLIDPLKNAVKVAKAKARNAAKEAAKQARIAAARNAFQTDEVLRSWMQSRHHVCGWTMFRYVEYSFTEGADYYATTLIERQLNEIRLAGIGERR